MPTSIAALSARSALHPVLIPVLIACSTWNASALAQESKAPAELDPMTVTATRVPRTVQSAPASVSVVEGEDLERLQAESADDILSSLPNVTTTGGPRSAAETPQIRGLDGSRVIVRVDGARQNFFSGHKGQVQIDPAMLKRVEVVRGPGSALYGSGALGGVISFETLDAADFLLPGDPLGAHVRSSAQSASDQLAQFAATYGQAGMVDALAAFNYRNAQDLEQGSGDTLPFSAFESTDLLTKLGLEPGQDQRLELSYERYDEDGETPLNAESNAVALDEVADRDATRDTVQLSYELTPSLWWLDLRATAYWTRTGIDETRLSDARKERREVETVGTDIHNTMEFAWGEQVDNAFTFGMEAFFDDTNGKTLRTGAEGPSDLDNPSDLASFPDATGTFYGLYAQHEFRLFDRFSLIPGLRYDGFDIESDEGGVDRSDEELSLKLGASVDLVPGLALYGSYGEGFNAPRPQDLFVSGLHFPGGFPLGPGGPVAPDNFFIANPDLKPERTKTWEVGTKLRLESLLVQGDALSGGLAYFSTDADDFIGRDVDIIGGTTSFANIDEAEIDGIEATLLYDRGSWYGGVTYSQVRGDDLVDDQPLSGMPADEWIVDLGYRFADQDMTIGYRARYAEDQDRVPVDEPATDGYTVHDVYLAYNITEGPAEGAQIGFRINNILDEDYVRAGSFVDEAGRDIRISLSMSF